jgi:glutaminyl-tRNA synthetase
MPTLAGQRRRGVPAAALREFIRRVGVARAASVVDLALYEHAIREVLNAAAPRRMAVLRPLKLVIENWEEGHTETLEAVNSPENPSSGTRPVIFGREIFIERDDFMEHPPGRFHRLSPGREVRLRYAWFVTCRAVVKDDQGEVVELRCTYDPATRGGDAPDGRKVRGTLHWVAAADAVAADVRLYNPLFVRPDPGADGDIMADLNPESVQVLTGCLLEPSLARLPAGEVVQFERQGYFCPDPDSAPGALVFNRTVGLRDSWARAQARE